MAEFYHVTLIPRSVVDRADIESKLNTALDWFWYNENCWVLYTTSDAAKWYARLEAFAKPEGELFIVKLDMSDSHGYMPKAMWNWIKNKQEAVSS